MSDISINKEWVLAEDGTPFYTTTWSPTNVEPKAHILFVHGYAEHIGRYEKYFPLLASQPHSIRVTAYDQRGHGHTAYQPLTATSPEVVKWKEEGKKVVLIKNGERKTGGWGKVFHDMEFFVKRESEIAIKAGKKLFLYGHSMGGGQTLAFCTRPSAPPSPSTLSLLSGAIVSGPLIRQTHPSSSFQLKLGSLASHLTPNLLIPTPLKYEDLSHNEEMNESNKHDRMCEQRGSLLGVSDMIHGGMTLDTPETRARWPKNLPLMMFHGGEDGICDPEATKRFFNGVDAPYKRLEIIEGMRHETHNELEPTPSNLTNMISEWVSQVVGEGPSPIVGVSKL